MWLVLLALSLVMNIYQWRNHTTVVEGYEVKTDSLITARVDVEKELSATYEELNKYKGINEHLDSLLAEANTKIDDQKNKISKLMRNEKNSGELNKKLQAELATLRKMRDEYLDKIDQLMVENQRLRLDSAGLAQNVESLTKSLESTVTTASVLKSEYIKVSTFKKKNNDKYVATAMAKRTNKMEICFSVLENKIAKSGDKNVYVRIIEPGGKVMGNRSSGSISFKSAAGEDMLSSINKTVTYNNEKTDVCTEYEEADRVFVPGNYIIEVYIDGNLSGAGSYVLR